MDILDVVWLDCDRFAGPFNRLIIALQPEIGERLAAIQVDEPRIVRALPNRLVEIFKAFLEFPEAHVIKAQAGGGLHVGGLNGERALVLRDGFLVAHVVRDFSAPRYAGGRAYRSERYTIEFDCAWGQRRRIGYVLYAGHGASGARVGAAHVVGAWRPVPPGAMPSACR